MTTDEQLIKQIREGESEEFGQLFRKYYGKIYSICLSILKNPHDAEEVASDTFISAYLKIDQLSKPDKFFPWLKRIAQNRSKDFLRSQKDTIEFTDGVPTMQKATHDFALAQINPERLILKQELIDAIMEAIESLPTKDREVIQAHIDGLNHSEISEQLDISISASMNRLYRAKKKIAAHVKNLLYGIIGLPKAFPFKKIVSGGVEFLKIGTSKGMTTGILTSTQSLMFSVIFHIVLFIALSFFPASKFHSDGQKVDGYLEVALIATGEQKTMQLPSAGDAKSADSARKSPSKVPRLFLSATKPAPPREIRKTIRMNQSMEALQIGTRVSVKDGDRIFSRERKGEEILQMAEGGSLGRPDVIKVVLSKKQSIEKQIKKNSFARQKEVKNITSQSGVSGILISAKQRENLKPADLNLVFVLARSDLTLDFTLLLKDYLSKYIAKIEVQERLAKQNGSLRNKLQRKQTKPIQYSIACGMVVYSPANLHGAGIYKISSEKGRLSFLFSELDKFRGDDTFVRYLRKERRGDRRALDGLAVALKKISFQPKAQRRILFVTRNKMGDVLDMHKRGLRYCPRSSLDDIIKSLQEAKIRVDVVGLGEPRARHLARKTGGSFSYVRLLETGELKP